MDRAFSIEKLSIHTIQTYKQHEWHAENGHRGLDRVWIGHGSHEGNDRGRIGKFWLVYGSGSWGLYNFCTSCAKTGRRQPFKILHDKRTIRVCLKHRYTSSAHRHIVIHLSEIGIYKMNSCIAHPRPVTYGSGFDPGIPKVWIGNGSDPNPYVWIAPGPFD